ncbi:MAG: hypothetical protein ACLSVD_00330 [Eggerthellaceae bacterium]
MAAVTALTRPPWAATSTRGHRRPSSAAGCHRGCGALFVLAERRAREPLMALSLFKNRNFDISIVASPSRCSS